MQSTTLPLGMRRDSMPSTTPDTLAYIGTPMPWPWEAIGWPTATVSPFFTRMVLVLAPRSDRGIRTRAGTGICTGVQDAVFLWPARRIPFPIPIVLDHSFSARRGASPAIWDKF